MKIIKGQKSHSLNLVVQTISDPNELLQKFGVVSLVKGTVRRELTGVESGINR
jgi:hypothetical protein